MADALTPARKDAIRKSWALVQQDMRGLGVAFFVKLFSEAPAYKKFFNLWKDATPEQIASDPALRAHASSVMHAITSIVDSLDDLGCLVEILKKQARNHLPRGIVAKDYKALFGLLLAFLKEKLGSAYDPATEDAWITATGVMAAVISDYIDEQQSKKGPGGCSVL